MKNVLLTCALLAAACSSAPGSDQNAGPGGSASLGGGSNSAGSSTGGSSSGRSSVGGSSSGGSGNAAGQAPVGGGSNAAGAAGTASVTKYGQVTFVQYFEPVLQDLNASFTRSVTGAANCDMVMAAGCLSSICDPAPSTGSPPGAAPTAGTITFSSADVSGSATVTADASGAYGKASVQFAKNFQGLEHAVFKATGAEVAAFEQEVDMPLLLLLSEPVAATLATSVKREADLSLTWTRGAPDVILYLQGSSERVDGKPGYAEMNCSIPSQPGAVTIPTALLQRLKSGAMLKAVTAHEMRIQAGDYSVLLAFASDVRNAANDGSVGFVLQ